MKIDNKVITSKDFMKCCFISYSIPWTEHCLVDNFEIEFSSMYKVKGYEDFMKFFINLLDIKEIDTNDIDSFIIPDDTYKTILEYTKEHNFFYAEFLDFYEKLIAAPFSSYDIALVFDNTELED